MLEKIINKIYIFLCWMDNVKPYPFKNFPKKYIIDKKNKNIIEIK